MQKTKTLSQLKRTITQSQGEHGTTAYRPKGEDEQNFFDQHKIEVIDDANGNDDAMFKGMSVKPINRMAERHGYDHEQAKKVYDLKSKEVKTVKEETELNEGEESQAQFQKYHADTAALLKKIHTGLSKHYANVTDKKGYNSGMAHWGHVGDIKSIHRQLQDIHDSILQQGEYAKPSQVAKLKEEAESIEERDELQGRIGINIINKKPRPGQTDLRNIPVGNRPNTAGRSFSDTEKKQQPERLKGAIKSSLGKHAKPNLPEEVEIDERTLTSGEMKQREAIVKGMKKNLSGFKSKYGKDAKSVMYATATKIAKEEVEIEDDLDVSLLELFASLNVEDRQLMIEMLDEGIDAEIFDSVEGEENNG